MLINEQNLTIQTQEDLYEIKQHGNIDYPIAIYHVDSSETNLELIHWHWHNELEYIIVFKGKARFFAGDTCHVLSAGQGMLINTNVLHRTKCFESSDCVYYSVVFHPSFIFERQNKTLSVNYLIPVFNNPNFSCLRFDEADEKTSSLYETLRKIINVNRIRSFGYELVTKKLLLEAWLILLNELKHISPITPSEANHYADHDEERIKLALSFISQHYEDPITLQDIAASAHISKSECCRCFKRCLQTTPIEYLIKYRVYASVRLFVSTKHSISDVAAMTGFNSSSYFNKMFKKYIGNTPTKFRRDATAHPQDIMSILEGHVHPNDMSLFKNLM